MKIRILSYLLLARIGLQGCGTLKGHKEARTAPTDYEEQLPADQQRRYDYYYLEAIRLKEQREYTSAFKLLQHCLSINPNAASALYEVAQYYVYLKQPERAIEMLERAVDAVPDNYWYAQGLVNLYLQQKQNDKAAHLLEQMAVTFRHKLDPLYMLLEVYTRGQDFDKSLDVLALMEQRMGRSEQLTMQKFQIYQEKGDTKRAFHEIESLVAEYPTDTRYRVVLADAYMQAGRKNEALPLYNQVLAEEPDNAWAMYSLAGYYERTGQTERYMQQMDTLLLNRKVEPQMRMAVMRQFIAQNEQSRARQHRCNQPLRPHHGTRTRGGRYTHALRPIPLLEGNDAQGFARAQNRARYRSYQYRRTHDAAGRSREEGRLQGSHLALRSRCAVQSRYARVLFLSGHRL